MSGSIAILLKFFFLLTPFFALSMFLALTQDYSAGEKRRLALRVVLSASVVSLVLFYFGNWLFNAFGITLDSFRIGAGALLFLSAVGLVTGNELDSHVSSRENASGDIAVVPLAIPVVIGPATTGALLIMGAETASFAVKLRQTAILLLAMAALGVMLICGSGIERLIGRRGIIILSKLTGLILSALAAQMIFTGVVNFLHS